MPEARLRSLPRVFFEGASAEAEFELPQPELDKLRKVLRLGTGDPIAVLAGDGSLIRCKLRGKSAVPEGQEWPQTEPKLHLTLGQALPKADRLESILRMCTEVGVAKFLLFPAERSVVRWDASKFEDRVRRFRMIVRESAEQCYRAKLPVIETASGLPEALERVPDAIVLSESESVRVTLREALPRARAASEIAIVVGPEGGWSPGEIELIGKRAVTLGPRVLRTDTAGVVASALALLGTDAEGSE